MRIVGNKLIARRNRGDTITFRLEYENGDPFVIASGWDNPHFVMTIASSRYSQEQRYIKSWWLSLTTENFIRVEQTDIYLDTTINPEDPDKPSLDPANWAFTRIVRVIYQGINYFWYSNGEDWIPYDAPTIRIVFTVQDASEWIEQNYRWDCSIMAGTLTNEGQGKPPLKDFIVVKSLVEDAEMEVSSDSMGGLK